MQFYRSIKIRSSTTIYTILSPTKLNCTIFFSLKPVGSILHCSIIQSFQPEHSKLKPKPGALQHSWHFQQCESVWRKDRAIENNGSESVYRLTTLIAWLDWIYRLWNQFQALQEAWLCSWFDYRRLKLIINLMIKINILLIKFCYHFVF